MLTFAAIWLTILIASQIFHARSIVKEPSDFAGAVITIAGTTLAAIAVWSV